MFQKIEIKQLQINEMYKILANNYVFKGRFKGFRYWNEIRATLDRQEEFSLEFDMMCNITIGLYFKRTNFNPTRPFYKFVSTNPRWKMERRSVNLFLRRLIGDEYFEW